ncbi:MAG: hypothetical protein KKA73_14265 [Chloroflexi bacterium]|nr:hypothetical protein [Chloroflexota bacterium]MBU1748850.1 hypothetical protein [Chloroflexota bacterium]
MSALALPKKVSQALVELTGEPREDVALVLLMRDYARHKLTEIDAALRRYEQKYGMSFEAYQRIWDEQDREEHYTYAAESDYLDWEALVTRRKRIESSFAWLP